MTNEERMAIARHIAAKVADEDFRDTLQNAQGIQQIGIVQVIGRMIISQMGIEFNEEAERLVGVGLACGYALGRDFARGEAMERSVSV